MGMVRVPSKNASNDDGATAALLREMVLAFAELDEQLNAGGSSRVLQSVATVAAERIPAASTASVSRFAGGEFITVTSSDPVATRADRLQREAGSGPCMDVISQSSIYNPSDLARDHRWPEFGRRVSAELGLHSMLSYRISASDAKQPTASLNVYGIKPHGFDDDAVWFGLLLATHARSAIDAAYSRTRIENLEHALNTSREIGTAVGIMMARYVLTRDQAFDLLRITSQRLNRKLHDVARFVDDTGELPTSSRPQTARPDPLGSGVVRG